VRKLWVECWNWIYVLRWQRTRKRRQQKCRIMEIISLAVSCWVSVGPRVWGSCAIRCEREVAARGVGCVWHCPFCSMRALAPAAFIWLFCGAETAHLAGPLTPLYKIFVPLTQIYAPPCALMQRKIHFCRHKFTPRCAQRVQKTRGILFKHSHARERGGHRPLAAASTNTVGMKRILLSMQNSARSTKMKCACD